MEAMDAQVAVLLLFDSETHALLQQQLPLCSEWHPEQYASTLDPLSFAGQVATHEEPTTVLDVFTTRVAGHRCAGAERDEQSSSTRSVTYVSPGGEQAVQLREGVSRVPTPSAPVAISTRN